MKKAIVFLLIITLSITMNFSGVSLASEDIMDFSAFCFGNNDGSDYYVFVNTMRDLGFNEVTLKNNNSTDPDMKPTANSFMDSDDADYAYFAGHGFRRANMPILYSTSGSYTSPDEYFCAETSTFNNGGKPTQEIGAEFLSGSTIATESKWDTDLEWTFMAACSQLNYGDQGDGGYWNGLNSAEIWARTLLSNSTNRAHGILGYYNSAPGGSTSVSRISKFFEYAIDAGTFDSAETMINSWKKANTPIFSGNSTWAAIVHRDNAGDYLRGQGTVTPDVPYQQQYTIDRYSLGGNNTNISLSSRSSNANNILEKKGQSNKTYRFHLLDVNSNYDKNTTSIEREETKSNSINKDKIINSLFKNYRSLTMKDMGSEFQQDAKKIKFYNGNKFKFIDNKTSLLDGTIVLSEGEAITHATKILDNLGVLPNDYYPVVSTVEKNTIIIEGDKVTSSNEASIVEYNITFYHKLANRTILSKEDEGIRVTLTKNGLHEIWYNWNDYSINNIITAENNVTIDHAINQVIGNSNQLVKSNDNIIDFYNVELKYFDSENSLIPVYSFDCNRINGERILVNAITGDIIK